MSRLRVFVSYTSSDESAVRRIVAALEDEDFDVWFAPQELPPGERLSSISDHIEAADVVLVMLSRAAMKSNWVQHEMNAAVAMRLEGKPLRVVPVLLEAVSRPPALADVVSIDFSKGVDDDRVQGLVALLAGEPAPLDELYSRFELYLQNLVKVDEEHFNSLSIAWGFARLRQSPALFDRAEKLRTRQGLEHQLGATRVSVGERERVLAALDQGKPMPVITNEKLQEIREWLRRYGTDELIELAAELADEVERQPGLRGTTLQALVGFLARRVKETDPDRLEWRAEALAAEATQAGLLARSTEQLDPRTYAYQDAQTNPSYDMGPMVRSVGRVAADFQKAEKGPSRRLRR